MRVRRSMLLSGLAGGLVLLGAAAPALAVDSDGDGVDDAVDVCNNTPAGTAVDADGRPLGDIDQDCDTDLEDHALFQQGFTGPLPYVVIDTVPVGNPGNPGDTRYPSGGVPSFGGVGYVYSIGRFEVTAGQYTEFLNAVADTDTYGLYNTYMWSLINGCKIQQTGLSGSYTYSVAADWADRPVNYVSWGDAARFANWLHNGQPVGGQDLSTTEDGSYFLDGATSSADLMAITRDPDATWAIPTEAEWYKAAYHYNDGVTGNYWDYPMGSSAVPDNGNPGGDSGNSANFFDGDHTIGAPYYRTEGGYFGLSGSPYGTFDQGGNVWEWNEAILYGSTRGVRGGSFFLSGGSTLRAAFRSYNAPTIERNYIGFRVAEVP